MKKSKQLYLTWAGNSCIVKIDIDAKSRSFVDLQINVIDFPHGNRALEE